MSKPALVTKWFMVAVALIVIGYDLIPFLNATEGDTVSEVTLYYASNYATLPFLWGVLIGHFFWTTPHLVDKEFKLAGLVVLTLLLISFDRLDYYDLAPIFPALGGIVAGGKLWPMESTQKIFTWK